MARDITVYACAGISSRSSISIRRSPRAEVRAASLQFVRKISGFTKPSKANEAAFDRAIDEVAAAARRLMDSLVTTAPARDREIEAAKARARAAERSELSHGTHGKHGNKSVLVRELRAIRGY